MIQSVLAVDPGKTTGVALIRLEDGKVSLLYSDELDADGLIPWMRPYLTIWRDTPPLRLVIEKFIINTQTAKKSQEASWALRMTGAVEQAARDADYPTDAIAWQKPSEAKTAFPNPTLKELGMWHKGGAGHALDAIRHGLVYLVKSGWTGH